MWDFPLFLILIVYKYNKHIKTKWQFAVVIVINKINSSKSSRYIWVFTILHFVVQFNPLDVDPTMFFQLGLSDSPKIDFA